MWRYGRSHSVTQYLDTSAGGGLGEVHLGFEWTGDFLFAWSIPASHHPWSCCYWPRSPGSGIYMLLNYRLKYQLSTFRPVKRNENVSRCVFGEITGWVRLTGFWVNGSNFSSEWSKNGSLLTGVVHVWDRAPTKIAEVHVTGWTTLSGIWPKATCRAVREFLQVSDVSQVAVSLLLMSLIQYKLPKSDFDTLTKQANIWPKRGMHCNPKHYFNSKKLGLLYIYILMFCRLLNYFE